MRHVAAVMVCLSFAILTLAQDAKWEPPAAPEGWKAVAGHDGRYRVAFPSNYRSFGTRDRTIKTGLRTLFKYTYATSRDGIMFDSGSATLSAAELRNKTIDQALDAFIVLEKGERFTISEPKEVILAGNKAREYRLTNDKVSRRLVVFGVTPRIFVVEVASPDASKLDGEAAETFFRSFVLVPEAVVKASVKEKEPTAKPRLTDQESLAKYGAKWTKDLKEMKPPDAPAVGVIRGREFKPDSVTLERTGRLTFRQGGGTVPDAEVDLVFVVKPRETAENRTIEVGEGRRPQFTPLVRLTTLQEGKKSPTPESFPWDYSMKLTLGAKNKDGTVPGTIFLCTPDAAHSFLAGKFTAKEK
jgi:hypothetical protein